MARSILIRRVVVPLFWGFVLSLNIGGSCDKSKLPGTQNNDTILSCQCHCIECGSFNPFTNVCAGRVVTGAPFDVPEGNTVCVTGRDATTYDAQCKEKCEAAFTDQTAGKRGGCEQTAGDAANTEVVGVCNANDPAWSGNTSHAFSESVALSAVVLPPNLSHAILTVGNSSATIAITGTLFAQPFLDPSMVFSDVQLTSPGGTINGVALTNVHFVSHGWIGTVGTTAGSTSVFTVPQAAIQADISADIDGAPQSFHVSGTGDAEGTFDSANKQILFVVELAGAGAIFNLAIIGTLVEQPPIANAGPPQTVECDLATGTGRALLDASGTVYPDHDPGPTKWFQGDSLPLSLLGAGTTLSSSFSPGVYTIEEHAESAHFRFSTSTTTVTVTHTKPPEFAAAPEATISVCNPGVQELKIPSPTVIDACAPFALRGEVVSVNGQPVGPIPIVSDVVTLAPGTLVVHWTATDSANNLSSTFDQTIEVLTRPTVYTSNSLSIDEQAEVVFGTVFGTVENSGAGATTLGGKTIVGDVLSAGPVSIGQGGSVEGWLKTESTLSTNNGVSIRGPVIQGSAKLKFFPPPPPPPPFPPPQRDVQLGPGESGTAAPGSFGSVGVQPNAELSLSSGTYFFASLDLKPNGIIRLDSSAGPVRIYISDSVSFHGAFVDPVHSSGSLMIEYVGTSAVVLQAPFSGAFYAPSARLELHSPGSTFTGEFYAKDLEVFPHVVVVHQPFSCP